MGLRYWGGLGGIRSHLGFERAHGMKGAEPGPLSLPRLHRPHFSTALGPLSTWEILATRGRWSSGRSRRPWLRLVHQ